MTEMRSAYLIQPTDLRDAMIQLAQARRDALLLELSQIERMLCISPTTSELRREWRRGSEQPVRLKD